jgi:Flp pilus assembly protein TadG
VRALPRRRRLQSGQTLVIFALSVLVLIGLAGLAIDVMRVYDQYAHQLRAAEAGALAGIIYMPTFYSTRAPAIDNNSAITRALQQVQMNGFGTTAGANADCNDLNTTGEVETCRSSKSTTALQVTVNEPVSVFLLSVVGVQNFTITATAGADFLDVNVLGSNPGPGDQNTWGDGGKSNPRFFNPSINGPGEFKEMGDPYVYCEDGSSIGPPVDVNYVLATTPLQHTIGGVTTTAGFVTNHTPYPGGPLCGSAQPDRQPAGFTGEATRGTAHPGAYNFAIKGVAGDTVWIFNAPFAPNDAAVSCNGSQVLDSYEQDNGCNNYYTTYGPLIFDGSHFDDPRFAFNVTYSLYRAESPFTRLTDVLVAPSKTFAPMDQIKADLTIHGCATNGSQSYDLSDHSIYTFKVTGQGYVPGNGCETTGSWGAAPYTWVPIGTLPLTTAVDTYRLAVEATPYTPNGNNATCVAYTCGWGRHTYAIAICSGVAPPVNGLCPGSSQISGWNNFDLYLNFPSATKNNIYVPVANIPSTYAGRTVNLRLFNPGPSHGNGDDAYFMIVPPDPCIKIHYPVATGGNNWVRTAPYPGTLFPALTGLCPQDNTSIYVSAQNPPGNVPSDEMYHGLWINITFDLPPSFSGGQFWIDNFSQKGKNYNQFAVAAVLAGGSPVHLIF